MTPETSPKLNIVGRDLEGSEGGIDSDVVMQQAIASQCLHNTPTVREVEVQRDFDSLPTWGAERMFVQGRRTVDLYPECSRCSRSYY